MSAALTFAHMAATHVKKCCRICGRPVDHKERRALFTAAGLRDRLAERLTLLSNGELTVISDDLSEFACKKCVYRLDKLSRLQVEAEKLKVELMNGLMETTIRHRSILRWTDKSVCGAKVGPDRCRTPSAAVSSIPVPLDVLASRSERESGIGGQLLKRPLPVTPLSATRPVSKGARMNQSPAASSTLVRSPLSATRPVSKRARVNQSPAASSMLLVRSPLSATRPVSKHARPNQSPAASSTLVRSPLSATRPVSKRARPNQSPAAFSMLVHSPVSHFRLFKPHWKNLSWQPESSSHTLRRCPNPIRSAVVAVVVKTRSHKCLSR